MSKVFDYAVPRTWPHPVGVGTRVRVTLAGRRVGGWVVRDNVTPPAGVTVAPLANWSGWGPPASVVELAEWAAWRWAGPIASFLATGSPPHVVRTLPAPAVRAPVAAPQGASGALSELTERALDQRGAVVLRLAPTQDLIEVVTTLAESSHAAGLAGSLLVLVPSLGWAERLAARLVRRGYAATTTWEEARAGWPIVVGSRAAAWAPIPVLAGAVVLDAHDEAYREESAPTYSAVDVVAERAAREQCAYICTSPAPPVVLSEGKTTLSLAPNIERAGWGHLEVVDRRGADPRTGLFSEPFVALARSVLDYEPTSWAYAPLVCVFNRTGRSLLLACRKCGELAQCTNCGAAVRQGDTGLECPRCAHVRPVVCAQCGHLRMKTLRTGVSRLREEIAALLHCDVGEVAGRPDPNAVIDAPVLIGTEAVLHRVRRAAAVAFLDIDLHLLAPRFSATDETLALLIRASCLVGAQPPGSARHRVLVQTRVPDHVVLQSVRRGDPREALSAEATLRRQAGLPPFAALAALSGALADDYAAELERAGEGDGVSVSDLPDGRRLVFAPTSAVLSDLLAHTPRPGGRGLRVEVDPSAI